MILDRALFKEAALSFGKVLLVLSLIILGQLFAKLLSKAAEGKIPGDLVLPLLGLGAIKTAVQLLPLALMLGLMLTFGRMYQDSEMVAIQASGVGLLRLYRPVLWLTLPVVMILAGLSLYVSPWSVQKTEQVIAQGKNRVDISGVTKGRFLESKNSAWVVFAGELSRKNHRLEAVFLHKRELDGKVTIEVAEQARQYTDPSTGERLLEMTDGARYDGVPGEADYQILTFGRHTMRIPSFGDEEDGPDTREGMGSAELWRSASQADKAQLQWRLSIPVFALVLGALALPLSYTAPRRGRYAKLALALVIYIAYINLVLMAVSLTEIGDLPLWLGAWWIHGLMVILISILLARRYGWRWGRGRLRVRNSGA
jgi:lipopolysaccharide export system permease protein